MPWLESHTVLIRHRKLRELSLDLRIRPAYTLGHLHALWHAAMEQQEDGDLSSWTDEFIATSSDYPGDAPQYVRLLQQHGWLDGKIIHDWLEYAGRYLESKYRTHDPEKLREIKLKHSRTKVGPKSAPRRAPNRTLPTVPTNHTEPPVKPAEAAPKEPEKYTITTPIQQMICLWKLKMGVQLEDRAWDKVFFPRFSKSASAMLTLFGGDLDQAMLCGEEICDSMAKKNLTWTPETVVKHAASWRNGARREYANR